ncbi:MAG TPA: phospholipase D-like domain-containing protein [Thermoanaerobaculia bacterium]|nr:phospholipase D-like domain-containing protein [Thermoanaerobaculia bacterium]
MFRPIPRPLAGRRLPSELRVGKVGRIAAELTDLADPRFEILLRRIDSAPIFGGNEIQLFSSGEEAFAAMREAAATAEREILVESYIFRDDGTGRLFAEYLATAAKRGVKVRVLTDAVGSFGTKRLFWAELESGGIEVRVFHPLLTDLFDQLVRDHRKIFVVDRKIAFTGGMNIGEEYGSLVRRHRHRSRPLDTWRDTHVRVLGPAAWDLATVFCEGWARSGGDLLALEPLPASAAEAPGARVLVLDTRPGRGQGEAASVFAAIVGAARRSVYLTNAYFAPGYTAVRILGEAAARGVDVRLLLPGKTDVPLVRHAGHGYFGDLLDRGVKVYEYERAILHAKTLVADGLVSVVGSTNLDFRSFVFNAECNLVILDRQTGEAMERTFLRDLHHAREIAPGPWRARPLPHRLGDRLARLLSPLL